MLGVVGDAENYFKAIVPPSKWEIGTEPYTTAS
jgi:hypothetical protein